MFLLEIQTKEDSARLRLLMEFDGCQKLCSVYVNGALVGEHKGGYTSFSVDITRDVKFGTPNAIAVRVLNRRDDSDRVPPMTAATFAYYVAHSPEARRALRPPPRTS